MSLDQRITLAQLVERHRSIRVPIIQRDYAQGRRTQKEIRDDFLDRLVHALGLPPADPTLPLNLDFIYGSIEGKTRAFQPLDGQQRLTTLFFMHWYSAWADDAWEAFEHIFVDDKRSRFSYRVRSSSVEFFDALVQFRPGARPNTVTSVTAMLVDQSWYFRSWRLDPTVQSALVMLDSLHARLARRTGLFARLVDPERPAITFQLLDLDNFGLSDDLYIKMNARGKPLTPFETFKARYENDLKQFEDGLRLSIGNQRFTVAEYVARRMDNAWGDLFWALRDRKSNAFDAALMNVLRAVALVTRDVESRDYHDWVRVLRSGQQSGYAEFHSGGWLDRKFTITLIRLLDSWSSGQGKLHSILGKSPHFDEKAMFDKIVVQGGDLSYIEVMLFAAYAGYLREHHDRVQAEKLSRFMRVIFNLAVNTSYNRSEDLRRSMIGLAPLIPHADRIEEFLADPDSQISGFSDKQVEEEKLKARLMLAHDTWRPLLARAEQHPYFRGQVEFLLSFSEVSVAAKQEPPEQWGVAKHARFQVAVEAKLAMGHVMFGSSGLKVLPSALWQRALLSLGNYLMPSGRNLSFLTSVATDVEGSWKRYLRYPTAERDVLADLWNRLDPRLPMEPQLDHIIVSATDLDELRHALVHMPRAITFCEGQALRLQDGLVYLLKRTQRNGAHAELHSYCESIRLEQLKFEHFTTHYETTTGTDVEPRIVVTLKLGEQRLRLFIGGRTEAFLAYVSVAEVEKAEVFAPLLQTCMAINKTWYVATVARPRVEAWLRSMDAQLAVAASRASAGLVPTPRLE